MELPDELVTALEDIVESSVKQSKQQNMSSFSRSIETVMMYVGAACGLESHEVVISVQNAVYRYIVTTPDMYPRLKGSDRGHDQ